MRDQPAFNLLLREAVPNFGSVLWKEAPEVSRVRLHPYFAVTFWFIHDMTMVCCGHIDQSEESSTSNCSREGSTCA